MTVLITGASGNLGRKLTQHLQPKHHLRLLDLDADPDANIQFADICHWDDAWVQQFDGVETVVHLAGAATAYMSWQDMIGPNMDGVVNVFNAAIQGGAKRIVFASSNHTMGGYRDNPDPSILYTDTAAQPGLRFGNRADRDTTPYGAFKLAAERLGKCYADIYGISFIGVRIGFVQYEENSAENIQKYDDWAQLMWLSDRDYCQLMTCCIEAPADLRFAIVNGMSNNRGMRWEIDSLNDLIGYVPQDDVMKGRE